MDVLYQPITGAPPPHDIAWVDDLLDVAAGQEGSLISRAMSMTREGTAGALLTFWSDPTGPAGPAPTRAVGGITVGVGRRYALVEQHTGCVPGAAKYLQTTTFHGPRDECWNTALLCAGAERIWPAIRDVPGITGSLLCLASDGGALALTLAVSVEALEAALNAIMTTHLLPGEDPALLTGPDRVEVHRLLHADLPDIHSTVRRAATVPS